MSAYLKGLITVSVITGIITALAPESKDGGLKKYIKYITSLILLVVLISPLVPVFTNIDSFGEQITNAAKNLTGADSEGSDGSITTSTELILRESVRNIKREVSEITEGKFGIPKENIDVDIQCDSSDIENIVIKKIKISIRGGSGNQAQVFLIEEYMREIFSCECNAAYA